MANEGQVTVWLQQVKAGDSQAAQQIWQEYYRRLVGLARKKMSDAPRRAADEDDVVISAFEKFFRGAQEGRFPQLDDRHDLWRILVMLTARDAVNQMKHEARLKRGGGRVRGESVWIGAGDDDAMGGIDQVVGAEPTPEFASSVATNCQQLLETLGDKTLQQIAVWKMEGYTNREIAQRLDCIERTVERKLKLIRQAWAKHAGQ